MKTHTKNKNKRAKLCRTEKKYPVQIILFGIIAGSVNGLVGSCGGIAMVFAAAYAAKHMNEDLKENEILATSLAAMLPVCAFALICSGAAPPSASGVTAILPALAGGALGAITARKIKGGSLRTVFAAVTIIAGLNMLTG